MNANHAGILAALAIASLAAACGPAPTPEVPVSPVPTAAPTVTPAAPPTVAPVMPAAAPTVAPAAPPAMGANGMPLGNTPIQPSKMLDELKAKGIDLGAYPELGKMSLETKKAVMPFFKRALGYASCTGCHVEGDFKAETRNLKIARGMWKHFVAELRDDKGGALFCDSCHAGGAKVLNRADKPALKKFMATDYEAKMARADRKDHECSGCHGDSLELRIFDKMWGVGK